MKTAVNEKRNFGGVYIDWKEAERLKPRDEHTLKVYANVLFSPSHNLTKADPTTECNKSFPFFLKFLHSKGDKTQLKSFNAFKFSVCVQFIYCFAGSTGKFSGRVLKP